MAHIWNVPRSELTEILEDPLAFPAAGYRVFQFFVGSQWGMSHTPSQQVLVFLLILTYSYSCQWGRKQGPQSYHLKLPSMLVFFLSLRWSDPMASSVKKSSLKVTRCSFGCPSVPWAASGESYSLQVTSYSYPKNLVWLSEAKSQPLCD